MSALNAMTCIEDALALTEPISVAPAPVQFLGEEMTFDQLFRYSEPKRVKRSKQVRGPPLEIDGHSDAVYHHFNFKSYPSTTGLRWHGYVKFKKPKTGKKDNRPLQHIPCEVDCSCPDFKFRFAWSDKQRGAARIGPQSLNKCINRAPVKTNPANIPGLCKHILATRDYIYGMLSKFPAGEPDTGEKLAQVVKWADTRWGTKPTDLSIFKGHMLKARDQEKWYAAVKRAVNAGKAGDVEFINQIYRGMGGTGIGIPRGIKPPSPPAEPTGGPPPGPETPPPLPPKAPKKPKKPGPVLPAAGKPTVTGQKPLAVPPGERGRKLPPAKPAGTMARITPPGKRGRGMPPFGESLTTFLRALVDRLNGSNAGAPDMRNTELKEAIRLIEEIQADDVPAPGEIAGDMADTGGAAPPPELPPSEPPVDDAAVGADSEANLVIQLLADIRHFLGILAGEEDVEGEEGMEGPGGPGGEMPLPGEEGEEEGGPIDAIPEAPEGEEEEEEDEEEDLATAGRRHGPEEPE